MAISEMRVIQVEQSLQCVCVCVRTITFELNDFYT